MELIELIGLRNRIEEALGTTQSIEETSTIQHVVTTFRALEDRCMSSQQDLRILSVEQLKNLLKTIYLSLNQISGERTSRAYQTVSNTYLVLCSRIIESLIEDIQHFLTQEPNIQIPLRQDLKPSRSCSSFFEHKPNNLIHAHLHLLITHLSSLKNDIHAPTEESGTPFTLRLFLRSFTHILDVLSELHDMSYSESLAQQRYLVLKTKIEEDISSMITPNLSSSADVQPMILSDFVSFLEEIDIDRRPLYWNEQLNQTWLLKMGSRIYCEVTIYLNEWLPKELHTPFKKRIRAEIDHEHFDLHHLNFDRIYMEYLDKTSWSTSEKEEKLSKVRNVQSYIERVYGKKYKSYIEDRPRWLNSERKHHVALTKYYKAELKTLPLTTVLTRQQIDSIIDLIRNRGEDLRYRESGYTQHTQDRFNLVYVRFAQKLTLLLNHYYKEPRSIVSILYAVDNLECPNVTYLKRGVSPSLASSSFKPVLTNLDIDSPFFEDFMQYYLYRVYLFDRTYYTVNGLFALNGTKLRMVRDEFLVSNLSDIGSCLLRTRDPEHNGFRALHLYELATLLEQFDFSVSHFIRIYFLRQWCVFRDQNPAFIETSLKSLFQKFFFNSTQEEQWLNHFRAWCDDIVYEMVDGIKQPRNFEKVYGLYALSVDTNLFLFEYALSLINASALSKEKRRYNIMENIVKLFIQKFEGENTDEPMLARRRWLMQEYQTAKGNVIPQGPYALFFKGVKVLTPQWGNIYNALKSMDIDLEQKKISLEEARALYCSNDKKLIPSAFSLTTSMLCIYHDLASIPPNSPYYDILPNPYIPVMSMLKYFQIVNNNQWQQNNIRENIINHPFWSFKQSRYTNLYDYMAYYSIFSFNIEYSDLRDDLLQFIIDYDPDESKKTEYCNRYGRERVELCYQRSLKLTLAPEPECTIRKTVSFHQQHDDLAASAAAGGGGPSASMMMP